MKYFTNLGKLKKALYRIKIIHIKDTISFQSKFQLTLLSTLRMNYHDNDTEPEQKVDVLETMSN